MGEPTETRRERLAVQAVNPVDGKPFSVQISHAKLQAVRGRSIGQVLEAAYTVPEVLQSPSAVFKGLKREADDPPQGENWLCYCGRPSHAYQADGKPREPWPGEVFLVFVSDELIVYNWYWVEVDPENANLPLDHSVRFRERVL